MDHSTHEEDARRPFQFRLRTLLAATAAICVILAPYRWFGAMYLVSAIISSLLVLCCLRSYMNRFVAGTVGIAVMGTLVGTFCGVGSITFFLHGVANFCAVLLGAGMKLLPRTMAILLTLTAIFVYGFAFRCAYDEYLRITQMRIDYPIQPLAERLRFEADPREAAESKYLQVNQSQVSQYSPAVLKVLDRRQQAPRYGYRDDMLMRLHHNATQQFAAAAGFGFVRMRWVSPMFLESEERKPIVLLLWVSEQFVTTDDVTGASDLHEIVLNEFLNPEDMGYIPNRKMAAGFESHGFRDLDEELQGCDKERQEWQLTRLQLVSLLRYDEPRVYVSDTLPAMDGLDEISHRSLNDFEKGALSQLRYQEDLVVSERQNRIAMLGAVRADNECLQCHDGERGRLLGAFSYKLVRVNYTLVNNP